MTVVDEKWIKEAQAGLDAAAEKIAQEVTPGFGDRGLAGWWNSLSEDTKNIIKNSLIGGAAGAGIMGGAGYMLGDEGEKLTEALKKGLIGGAAGALAGGSGTAAYNLLTGGRQMPGETSKPQSVVDAGTDELAGRFLEHPLTYAGAGTGAYLGLVRGDSGLPVGLSEPELGQVRSQARQMIKNWRDIAKTGRGISDFAAPPAAGAVPRAHLIDDFGILDRLKAAIKGYTPGAETRAFREAADVPASAIKRTLTVNPLTRGRYTAAMVPLLAALGYGADRIIRGDDNG